MPSYRIQCENNHVVDIECSYEEFDAAGGVFNCPAGIGGCAGRHPVNPNHQHTMSLCGLPARVVFDSGAIPVAHFNGPGFTRRSTDPRANGGIDNRDWRMGENWPGPVEKKIKRPKITNWTNDDFRKGAI
jgi:hypothetical protein